MMLCTPQDIDSVAVIQNVANPRQNSRVGKVFELAKPYFRRDMERDFCI